MIEWFLIHIYMGWKGKCYREQGGKIIQAPGESEFGWMGVVEDPERRKVELYKSEENSVGE